jgi:wyosine [tRNA(Phe)-imidazoG37] synthetase (radical SAM superfamily)
VTKGKAPRPAHRLRIYGPVPSRRLGFSLGVDILPYKTCSFNCIYCQLGPGRRLYGQRKAFVPVEEVVSQVRRALRRAGRVDSITFSGSGEPTLHTGLGRMIREIKKVTDIPVTVLTNSSLLTKPAVRRALRAADRVIPSLDAARPAIFRRINRPHPSLTLRRIIDGLAAFRKEYKGKIWLEIMLVKGLNDSAEHVRALKRAVARIRPDKVQLNTVVRPPAEPEAQPLSTREMAAICRQLGPPCEVVASFRGGKSGLRQRQVPLRVLDMLRRRPLTAEDIKRSLGLNRKSLEAALTGLLRWGRIRKKTHAGRDFYEPAGDLEERP